MIDFKLEFKKKFLERYSKLTDINKFLEYSQKFLTRSIRVNTLKTSVKELKSRLEKDWKLTQVPWCKEGFWIEHKTEDRRDIGNLLEHSLGYFYVQETASMIPPIVLNPKQNTAVLDMAASPGSKTTQLAAIMKNTGIIIANDVDYTRLNALSINLERCGVSNIIITLMHGRSFKSLENSFDYVLLDAPCSGTGTIRKSAKTAEIWNPDMIKRLAGMQKLLIDTAFNCLKKNGVLVYSTCSLEPEENEAVVNFLINKYSNAKLQKINLKIKKSPTILKFEGDSYSKEIKKCLRIWPQDNDTDGFFVAKIKKL
ncbi:MAG: NOL1/NOP2/sun family putative RNA methylase [Nanoarchaeota archaeon]